MTQSSDAEMIGDFLSIAREAAAIGPKVFREWVENPEKYLRPSKRYSLPIDGVLRSLDEQEIEKITSIVEFFSSMSVQHFLRALEDGTDGYRFELTMRHEESDKAISLINNERHRNLQGLV